MRLNFLKHTGTGLVLSYKGETLAPVASQGTSNLRKMIQNGKIILNEGLLNNSGKMVTIDDSNLEGKKSIQNPETRNT